MAGRSEDSSFCIDGVPVGDVCCGQLDGDFVGALVTGALVGGVDVGKIGLLVDCRVGDDVRRIGAIEGTLVLGVDDGFIVGNCDAFLSFWV